MPQQSVSLGWQPLREYSVVAVLSCKHLSWGGTDSRDLIQSSRRSSIWVIICSVVPDAPLSVASMSQPHHVRGLGDLRLSDESPDRDVGERAQAGLHRVEAVASSTASLMLKTC